MTTNVTRSTTLEHLFDADLAYRDDFETVVGGEDREGVIIGSGNGTVRGPRIRGSIRWSFYAHERDTITRFPFWPWPGRMGNLM